MSTYTWRNRLQVDLPMRMAQHDPVNGKTLNVGRGGSTLDADFGAGAAEPTKLDYRRGYSFDGSDYLEVALDVTAWTAISILMTFDGVDNAFHRMASLLHSGGDDIRIFWDNTPELIVTTDDGAMNTVTVTNGNGAGIHTVGLIFDGTTLFGYLDGVQRGSDNSNDFDFSGAAGTLTFGSFSGGGSAWYTGNILHSCAADFAMTPTQVAAYDIEMKRRINKI